MNFCVHQCKVAHLGKKPRHYKQTQIVSILQIAMWEKDVRVRVDSFMKITAPVQQSKEQNKC